MRRTFAKIPRSHIICTASMSFRDIETLKKESSGRVWDVDTGHDLMITEPDQVAEFLLRVAQV